MPIFPPLALYSLPYLLPQFRRTLQLPNAVPLCLTRNDHASLVDGISVTPCRSPSSAHILHPSDVAELFFASPPAQAIAEEARPSAPVAQGELQRWVTRTSVPPKSGMPREP